MEQFMNNIAYSTPPQKRRLPTRPTQPAEPKKPMLKQIKGFHPFLKKRAQEDYERNLTEYQRKLTEHKKAVGEYPRRIQEYEQSLVSYREYEKQVAAYEQYIDNKFDIERLRRYLDHLREAEATVSRCYSDLQRGTSVEGRSYRNAGWAGASSLCGNIDVRAKAEIETLSSEECEYLSWLSGEKFVSKRKDVCSCGSSSVSKTVSSDLCRKDDSPATWKVCLTCVRENQCHFTEYRCNRCGRTWNDR
jgi:hypothetical protein